MALTPSVTPQIAQAALDGLLGLYALLLPWRALLARDVYVGLVCTLSYVAIAALAWWWAPFLAQEGWWLPLYYPYLWAGLTALVSLPGRVRLTRRGVMLQPGFERRLGVYLTASLVACIGVLCGGLAASGLWLAFALSPSLVVCASYATYRLLLLMADGAGALSWRALLAGVAFAPALLALSVGWQSLVRWLPA